MRKELYQSICYNLNTLYKMPNGDIVRVWKGEDVPEGAQRIINHIDLWNHNVEFIEQEESWSCPAVFVEFAPIKWNEIVLGLEYRAEPFVKLHIVTEWKGASADGSELSEEALSVFDLPETIHSALSLMGGSKYLSFDLVESHTNHNHEDIVENIEVYQCVAIKRIKQI